LDQATAGTSAGLKIFIDAPASLNPLKEILDREGKGKGEVTLISQINDDTEIEVRLPDKYNVSAVLAQAVKAVPGILEVREI